MATKIGEAFYEIRGDDTQLRKDLKSTEDRVEESGDKAGGGFMERFGDRIVSGFAALKLDELTSALGEKIGDAFSAALGTQDTAALLQTQLGLSPEEAGKLGKVSSQLYRDAWGESMSEVSEAVSAVASTLGENLDTAGIEDITEKALGLSKAFGIDVADAASTAGILIKTGLADSSAEALDLLTVGLQEMPAAIRDELLEASNEYSQFFGDLGFSGSEAFGLLADAADRGVFGIDKTGDAIKEFTIRSTDLSATSKQAYETIGLSAEEMTTKILEGGDGAKQAFDDIISGLLSIEDPGERAQAAIALFGTPIEDIGVTQIPDFLESLQSMNTGLGDVEGAAQTAADTLSGTASERFEAFRRKALGKLTDFIANKVIPVVEDIGGWFEDHWPAISKVASDAIDTVKDALEDFWDIAKGVFDFLARNQPVLAAIAVVIGGILVAAIVAWTTATWAQVSALLAQAAAFVLANAGIILIIAAIAALVAAVVYAYQNWEWFRTAVDAVRAWMVDTLWPALQAVFGWLRDHVPPIVQAVARFFTDTLWPALQAVFGWIRDNVPPILQAMWAFFTDKILPVLNAVWSFITDYLYPIIQAVFGWLRDNVPGIIETVVGAITTLWGWLKTLWDRSEGLRAFLVGAFKLAFDTVVTVAGAVSTAIETVYGWLKDLWDRGESVRAFLAGAFWLAVTTVRTAFDAISTAVSTVWSWFQTIWDKGVEVAGYFEGAFKTALGVAETAWGGIRSVIEAVVGWLDSVISKAQSAIGFLQDVKDLVTLDITSKAAPGIGQIPGQADGGPVRAGQPYIVGERGWEFFVPKVSGHIIPHDQSVAMASAGSGSVGSIVININAQGASEDAASAIGAAAEAGVLSALAQYTSAR